MIAKKVLVVDDEMDILRLIETVLKKEGIKDVITAATAQEAWTAFQREQPDLVLLDIMLPDGEGYEVCKQIRAISTVPILFLSAKSEEIDRILGFAMGGDDYITKPFSPKEVAYRVKAQLRRASYVTKEDEKEAVIKVGPFELNETELQFYRNKEHVELNRKELGLMTYFMKHQNKVISKESLYEAVWGEDMYGYDNTIMVHIRRLREKIENNPSKPQYLLTVKGLGYKLVVKDE
ncbi:response regulator [Fictibacillus macauensis ZFHKF-1]|uniref:Response regulator n=2 Tax=Fictibacillus TaxID=1329200 RepID=I8AKW1_9BACL|nr:response regulator [Fictibacillus macauensis ZFHKF-1]